MGTYRVSIKDRGLSPYYMRLYARYDMITPSKVRAHVNTLQKSPIKSLPI